MAHLDKHYIGGTWVAPLTATPCDVINPATEAPCGTILLGGAQDADRAVDAAVQAFPAFADTTKAERIDLLETILETYKKRYDDVAEAIMTEMGAPISLAKNAQAGTGVWRLVDALETLKAFEFDERVKDDLITYEPVGVCGLITPWNWPVNQITAKVGHAIAAGCTMVLKPSEVAPLSAHVFAGIMHEAGVPAGVFNMVDGDGPTVGAALSAHPAIDMMSFTGSTLAGTAVARAGADTVKRIAQELGGKSANILLDDVDFSSEVVRGFVKICLNTGQSCNAPSRMLVPLDRMDEVAAIAADAASQVKIGVPSAEDTYMGPLVSEAQWNKVQRLIQAGIDEGARLACGGTGKPEGFETGYYVKPTIFTHATNDMTIAREEIFGPVLTVIGYSDEEDAIRIANETEYGLSGYVQSTDIDRARRVARAMRTGNVHINAAGMGEVRPFGGYKRSGNGREGGRWGLHDFLEVKAIMGYYA